MTSVEFKELVKETLMNDRLFGEAKTKDETSLTEEQKAEAVKILLGDVDVILGIKQIDVDEETGKLRTPEEKREQIKLSLDGIETLWAIVSKNEKLRGISYLQAVFQAHLAEKTKNIDFSRESPNGSSQGKLNKNRDRNKALAWDVVGKQFRAFRFMSMLSNPTVFFKNMWLNKTNAFVQKRLINPVAGR